jgi:hypothetical protein
VDEPDDEWSRRLQETLSVIQKANPANNPTPEDITLAKEAHAYTSRRSEDGSGRTT